VIRILPESLINKIAAGEVVDRPASVVKELVENSIDAGGDRISVIIREGGKSFIQVVDNGTGMSQEDALLSFERHSTSKISTPEDLENIRTLGFRGEALASIASVSRVEMRTKRDEDTEATLLRLEGGVLKDMAKTGGNRGTSVVVKNLFFNTPARRKFLKSAQTEFRHILNVMNRFILAYWEVAFTLINEGREVYNLRKADLVKRIKDLFGERYSDNIIGFYREGRGIRVSGYVGNMDTFRKSRGEQFIFLNRRFIQHKGLNHAVLSAYGSSLPQGAFPFYALFLDIDPRRADVNVHPTKIEAKFSDESLVYSLVYSAVKEALSSERVIPQLKVMKREEVKMKKEMPVEGSLSLDFQERETDAMTRSISQERREARKFDQVNLWQLHNKYILSQIKSGLTIIDQHLAHERILYEKALNCFKGQKPSSQQLLFPQAVQLSPEDYYLLMEIQLYLEKLGFIVKDFGGNTVVVEAVPAEFRRANEEKILLDIIDDYKKNKGLDVKEDVAKSYACKAAIKAGEKLTLEEMNSLVDQLFATRNPYFCPHGRPIIVNISLEEIDRRFLR